MTEQRIRLRGVGPQLRDQAWESTRLLRIGRSGPVEALIDDPSISRRHAEIALAECGWVLRDTGSTNGTFLNGVRVGRTDRKLKPRDLVQCGNVVLLVDEVADGSATEVVDAPPIATILTGCFACNRSAR